MDRRGYASACLRTDFTTRHEPPAPSLDVWLLLQDGKAPLTRPEPTSGGRYSIRVSSLRTPARTGEGDRVVIPESASKESSGCFRLVRGAESCQRCFRAEGRAGAVCAIGRRGASAVQHGRPCSACSTNVGASTAKRRTIGRTEQTNAGIAWGLLCMLAMIGGGMVPQFVMPAWMKQLGSISPVRWTIEALEGGIWRDYSLADAALPLAASLGFGVLGLFAGLLRLRRI